MSIEDRDGKYLFGGKFYIDQSTGTFELNPYSREKAIGNIIDMFSAEYYENLNSAQIQTSSGSSGAGRAVAGAILFGPIGAIAGGLSGRKSAQFETHTIANYVGFVITYKSGNIQKYNVLHTCFRSSNTPYNGDLFLKAKSLSTLIINELQNYIGRGQVNSGNPVMLLGQRSLFVPEVDFYSVRLVSVRDAIGLYINVKNVGANIIDSVNILVRAFDKDRKELYYLGANTIGYDINAINIAPGEHDELSSGINIGLMGSVQIIQATIYKYHKVNGETIYVPNDSLKWVEAHSANN